MAIGILESTLRGHLPTRQGWQQYCEGNEMHNPHPPARTDAVRLVRYGENQAGWSILSRVVLAGSKHRGLGHRANVTDVR